MKFEWDESKNQKNIRDRGLDFADAREMFEGPMLVYSDERRDYGENRRIDLSYVGKRMMVVVFTELPGVIGSSLLERRTPVSRVSTSKPPSQTDWGRVDAMKDDDIDYSEIPELGEEFFAKAVLVWPPEKKQLSMRLDTDVIEWFKGQGGRYQTRINAVLRKYMEAHKR